MICRFCGHQVRDGALFCSHCGRSFSGNQSQSKKLNPSQKKSIIIIASIVALALLVAVFSSSSTSIEGVWMSGSKQIVFTKDGEYKSDSNFGTYTVNPDKSLEIRYSEYSFKNGVDTFIWGEEAKEDPDYWYISDGKLYFYRSEYTKQ